MNSSSESSSLKLKTTYLFIIILLTTIVYFNSLKGSFQYDDRNLLTKDWITNLDSYAKNVNLSSFQNRPILLWTFAINNYLDSQNTYGFHLINLILHICVTILIFFISIRLKYLIPVSNNFIKKDTLNLLKDKNSYTLFFSFAVAIIFALHPLNTDSVTYISSRSSILAVFFYLLTVYLFTKVMIPNQALSQRILLNLLIIPGIYLAIASKLIAVSLPIILIIWFIFIKENRYPTKINKYLSTYKILLFLCVGGIILIVSDKFLNILYSPKDQGLELFGRVPYFLIQIKVVIFYYLKQFVLPFNLNVDTGFPFTQILSDWTIVFSIVITLGIIFMIIRWGNAWIKLGSIWFFISLAPTSTIVPLNDIAVEHRLYLPMSLGLCLITGWFISQLKKENQSLMLIFIILISSVLVVKRNQVWTSEINLWSDSALKNPNSSRVHNNLGKAYFEKGQLSRARIHLEKSVSSIPEYVRTQFNIKNKNLLSKEKKIRNKTLPNVKSWNSNINLFRADFAEPHFNLASVYLNLGKLEEAETEYKSALHLKPDYYAAELGLGSVKNMKQDYDLAIQHFKNSIEIMKKITGKPDYPIARLNLGEVYGKTLRYKDAIVEFNKVIKEDPSMFLAHFNLGTAYMLMGSNDKAKYAFKECLNLNPNHEPALFNLARIYQNQELWKKSNSVLMKFLKIKGPNSYVYSAMGWNTLMSGKLEEANKLYEKVLTFESKNPDALINLAKINYSLGKLSISKSYVKRAIKLDLLESQSIELEKLLK
jgi:tetratricopeptide (TPR) repeat protein